MLQPDDVIELRQQHYVNGLSAIEIDKSKGLDKDAMLDEQEKEVLRTKIGQILWVARQSRPDIMFDVCHLASSYAMYTRHLHQYILHQIQEALSPALLFLLHILNATSFCQRVDGPHLEGHPWLVATADMFCYRRSCKGTERNRVVDQQLPAQG